MDWSIVIAVTALVFSLLSPILSAWITGRYRLKEKRLEITEENERRDQEFFQRHRAEVIENYIRTAGSISSLADREALQDYGSNMGEIYLYVDEGNWGLLDLISEHISNRRYVEAKFRLVDLCKILSKAKIRVENNHEPNNSNKKRPRKVRD